MAKTKALPSNSTDPNLQIPDNFAAKLRKLIIKNFGCISSSPVEVDLDDIVVLVGTNNSGKSTILRAYEVLFSSSDPVLTLGDFPNHVVDANALPEIELHTAVNQNPPGHRWINRINGENIIRERWRWSAVGEKAVRQGFDAKKAEWSDQVPWGTSNVANSRRPKPHRIEAFTNPDQQARPVVKLLKEIILSNLKAMPEESEDDAGNRVKTEYGQLLELLVTVQRAVVAQAEKEIKEAEDHMTDFAAEIFQGYRVQFDARPDENIRDCLNFFKAEPQLKMGPEDGHFSTADRQGSGARRTLMWAALRYAAEAKIEANAKNQFLLLLDEPELCLHPNAIREACRVLYELPETSRWQVMLTTHSPIFIDLSRDNTTVVRVERDPRSHRISGTTVFRPSAVNLSPDEKELLKLLNVVDPYVSEFFFGGKTVLVEGDTEYTALKYVASCFSDDLSLRDVHIVRARGKATICLLTRILNQFNARYAVLHDSDVPKAVRRDGKEITNPAWTNNQKIRDSLANRAGTGDVRLVALLTNFENAFFGQSASDDKPYNAWQILKDRPDAAKRVKELLDGLVDFSKPLPPGAIEWNTLDELEAAIKAK
jgi:putative ATP-dependent endonuclease of OLD family